MLIKQSGLEMMRKCEVITGVKDRVEKTRLGNVLLKSLLSLEEKWDLLERLEHQADFSPNNATWVLFDKDSIT
jgi:hypothetical protein